MKRELQFWPLSPPLLNLVARRTLYCACNFTVQHNVHRQFPRQNNAASVPRACPTRPPLFNAGTAGRHIYEKRETKPFYNASKVQSILYPPLSQVVRYTILQACLARKQRRSQQTSSCSVEPNSASQALIWPRKYPISLHEGLEA